MPGRGRAEDGAAQVGELSLPGARNIVREPEKDMFRLGVDEAHAQGYEEGYAAALAAARGEDHQ